MRYKKLSILCLPYFAKSSPVNTLFLRINHLHLIDLIKQELAVQQFLIQTMALLALIHASNVI